MFCVRDLDHPIRHAIPAFLEDELSELIWRKGPMAHGDPVRERSPPEQPTADAGEIGSAAVKEAARQLFMEEDEMASWLHCQIGDDGGGGDLYKELLEAATGEGGETTAGRGDAEKQGLEGSRKSMVELSEIPEGEGQAVAVIGLRSGSARARAGDGRKRKAREGGNSECHGENAEFESGDKRKDACRSASTRRSRAAEVHSLAERRRRDRINEKMKALQELIPRCNKSDKASTLDEAIEYLKSLQLQVQLVTIDGWDPLPERSQMMSVGCNMGPVMLPGVQTYLPPIGIGMGTGMGIGLGMGTGTKMGPELGAGGLGRPVLHYGSFLPWAPFAGSVPVEFGPRFLDSFHSAGMDIADQIRVQAPSQRDPTLNLISSMQGTNMVQIPCTGDPYCHFISLRHFNGSAQSCIIDEPGTRKGTDDAENNKLG